MDTYRHNVSASFAQRAAADRVLSKLLKRGLSREQLQILDASEHTPLGLAARLKSRSARNAMLTYGAIGAVVGGVLGALAQAALVISDMGLLTASPSLAPIMLMGWGAFLGALLGALIGLAAREAGHGGESHGPVLHPVSLDTARDLVAAPRYTPNMDTSAFASVLITGASSGIGAALAAAEAKKKTMLHITVCVVASSSPALRSWAVTARRTPEIP